MKLSSRSRWNETGNSAHQDPKRTELNWQRIVCINLVIGAVTLLGVRSSAQTTLPFEISNPKHLTWSMQEAERIYDSACMLVARSVRPNSPPHLQPKFILVLGAKADQMVREGQTAEIHLKKWDPARFAEAMVLLTFRDTIKNEDVVQLARETLNAAEATVSVNELRRR